ITDGWIDDSRFYGISVHIELRPDGRIWVHEDNTDMGVVDRLLEKGIEKAEIVIGWHAPSMRSETAFAVN
ncbi:MAG: element excision factor XisI family protein, partial [Bacteroidota bacterium]